MVLPGISPVFCFVGFVLFLSFRLVWFIYFFCWRLFSIFMRSFCSVSFFPRRGPLSGSLFSSSSGFSLGRVCPALGFLAGVSSFGFSSYVSQCCGPPGPSSHGVLCCWLLFRVVFHLVLLSSVFGVRVLSSSSFVVSVPGGGLLPPVVLLPCTVRALPLFLLMGFFFPLVLVVFSLLLVLLLILFLLLLSFLRSAFSADSSSCSSSSSLLRSLLPLFVLVPRFGFRRFWGVASSWAFPVTLLGLLFWEGSLWSSSSVLPSLFVLLSLLFFWLPSVWGPLLAEVAGL